MYYWTSSAVDTVMCRRYTVVIMRNNARVATFHITDFNHRFLYHNHCSWRILRVKRVAYHHCLQSLSSLRVLIVKFGSARLFAETDILVHGREIMYILPVIA